MHSFTLHTMLVELDGRQEFRLVALAEDKLLAVASIANWGTPAVTLFGVFVAKEWRQKGLGRLLVAAAGTKASKVGAHAISAIVSADGPVGFWEKLGFRVVHLEGEKRIMTRFLEAK